MTTKKAYSNETKKAIICTADGEKDLYGKAIWRDEDGKAYELSYARHAKKYFFIRYPAYDRA